MISRHLLIDFFLLAQGSRSRVAIPCNALSCEFAGGFFVFRFTGQVVLF